MTPARIDRVLAAVDQELARRRHQIAWLVTEKRYREAEALADASTLLDIRVSLVRRALARRAAPP